MRTLVIVSLVLLTVALSAEPCASQSDDLKALRQEIEALREEQRAIRKELRDLSNFLRERAGAPTRDLRDLTIGVGGAPFRGKPNAPVTLVEFSDYQCPFCARHARETFPQIQRDFIDTGKLKYVFRDFPIESIHPDAFSAAATARCAGAQGKFWDMHDRLFANQSALGQAQAPLHAQALGLDAQLVRRCLDSGNHTAEIRRDIEDGLKAGLRSTPTFFLGSTDPGDVSIKVQRMLVGAQPYARFKDAIESLLASPK